MRTLISLSFCIFVFSCNHSSPKNNSSSGDDRQMAASQFESEISVTIENGPHAGTYHINTKDPTCSEGLTGKNSFGNQYSENGKSDNELSSLQLIIPDRDSAKKGTADFFLTITFGKLLQGKSYVIDSGSTPMSSKKSGTGKATYSESGSTKTVFIEGKTDDGTIISAKLKCKSLVTGG